MELLKGVPNNVKLAFDSLPNNAAYMSKDSQNKCLNISAGIVLKKIVDGVSEDNDGFFALIIDEARDISTKKQMPICV